MKHFYIEVLTVFSRGCFVMQAPFEAPGFRGNYSVVTTLSQWDVQRKAHKTTKLQSMGLESGPVV